MDHADQHDVAGLQRVLLEMSSWIGIQCLPTLSLISFAFRCGSGAWAAGRSSPGGIDVLKRKLTHLSSYTVNLIVTFSLQTILLHLLVLKLLTYFFRSNYRLVVAPSAAGTFNRQTPVQNQRKNARNDAHGG